MNKELGKSVSGMEQIVTVTKVTIDSVQIFFNSGGGIPYAIAHVSHHDDVDNRLGGEEIEFTSEELQNWGADDVVLLDACIAKSKLNKGSQ